MSTPSPRRSSTASREVEKTPNSRPPAHKPRRVSFASPTPTEADTAAEGGQTTPKLVGVRTRRLSIPKSDPIYNHTVPAFMDEIVRPTVPTHSSHNPAPDFTSTLLPISKSPKRVRPAAKSPRTTKSKAKAEPAPTPLRRSSRTPAPIERYTVEVYESPTKRRSASTTSRMTNTDMADPGTTYQMSENLGTDGKPRYCLIPATRNFKNMHGAFAVVWGLGEGVDVKKAMELKVWKGEIPKVKESPKRTRNIVEEEEEDEDVSPRKRRAARRSTASPQKLDEMEEVGEGEVTEISPPPPKRRVSPRKKMVSPAKKPRARRAEEAEEKEGVPLEKKTASPKKKKAPKSPSPVKKAPKALKVPKDPSPVKKTVSKRRVAAKASAAAEEDVEPPKTKPKATRRVPNPTIEEVSDHPTDPLEWAKNPFPTPTAAGIKKVADIERARGVKRAELRRQLEKYGPRPAQQLTEEEEEERRQRREGHRKGNGRGQ